MACCALAAVVCMHIWQRQPQGRTARRNCAVCPVCAVPSHHHRLSLVQMFTGPAAQGAQIMAQYAGTQTTGWQPAAEQCWKNAKQHVSTPCRVRQQLLSSHCIYRIPVTPEQRCTAHVRIRATVWLLKAHALTGGTAVARHTKYKPSICPCGRLCALGVFCVHAHRR